MWQPTTADKRLNECLKCSMQKRWEGSEMMSSFQESEVLLDFRFRDSSLGIGVGEADP